jgi:dethiobiotin synthetase
VVTAAGLGALNHTALTLEALAARRLCLAGVVIGSWPRRPGAPELSNLADLESIAGRPLSGALPAGAARRGRAGFSRLAREGLAPGLGGRFDPAVFQERYIRTGQHVPVEQTHAHVKEPS